MTIQTGKPTRADVLSSLSLSVKGRRFARQSGRLSSIEPPILRAKFPGLSMGERVTIETSRQPLKAQVIGFSESDAILSPYGRTEGLRVGSAVYRSPDGLDCRVGPQLLGRVVDGLGLPIDGRPGFDHLEARPIMVDPPLPFERPVIKDVFETGLRVIDGLNTLGQGQRIALFGGPGTGKSTFMTQMVSKSKATVIVLALIGERGREVRDFLERHMKASVRNRTVTIAATSDRPAMERATAVHTACSIAEYFRDQGENVLLVVDSLTRVARALREIGLAAGEPPARRGFPASVYSALPGIIERAGGTKDGSITAMYSVLSEGDIEDDPMVEEVKSLTDGHLVLSREKAELGIYPAIDLTMSLSRLMTDIVKPSHNELATKVRGYFSMADKVELLVKVGEYKRGVDLETDTALRVCPKIEAEFVKQGLNETSNVELSVEALQRIIK